MRKAINLFLIIIFLSGCATYKFQHGKIPPYDKGYVVSRDGYTILEYTIGRNNSVPEDLNLAKERFKRRANRVEDYYKRMGCIENNFKRAVWDPLIVAFKFITGVFRLPFVAISDYRYEHNVAYRNRVRKIEQEKDMREQERIEKLKEELNNYIQRDLAFEDRLASIKIDSLPVKVTATEASQQIVETIPENKETISLEKPIEEVKQQEEHPVEVKELEFKQEFFEVSPAEKPQQIEESIETTQLEESKQIEEPTPEIKESESIEEPAQPTITEESKQIEELTLDSKEIPFVEVPTETGLLEEKVEQSLVLQPKAVIIAKPTRGYSPLTVHFYGHKSFTPIGKIVSYYWDFGDGDTSTKKNPVNIFYSNSFEPERFVVTLTVKDSRGKTATTSTTIEVLNK